MKSKIIFTGVVILVVLFGFIVSNNRQETDQDLLLIREYSRGYTAGYKAKQKDLEFEVEAWKRRYFYMIDLEVERWRTAK